MQSWQSAPVIGQAPRQPAPALPTQPQPFPGARPITTSPNPTRQREQERADIRTDIDVNANRRAEEELEMRRRKLAQEQKEFEDKQRALAANSGIDTQVGQDQAGSHVVMLETSLRALDDIAKTNPRDLAPTWFEKGVGVVTGGDPDFTSMAQNENRQIATAAYKNAIQSAIWLSTGAAAPEQQVADILASIMPAIGDLDNPGTLRFKRKMLQGYIESAKTRAGPANVKVLEALTKLEEALPTIYGANSAVSALRQDPGKGPSGLSAQDNEIPIPPEMQAEYEQFMASRPPGSLDAGEYLDYYEQLAKKYDFGLPPSAMESARKFVDAYNKGNASLTIPNPSRELEGVEKFLAEGAADKGLVGDAYSVGMNAANAFSFGLPEFMTGREGRAAFDQANKENPYAALTGEVLGSLAPGVGLAKGATRALQPVIENPVTRELMGEVAGNSLYAGVRGAAGAEPENRAEAAAMEALYGGGGALAARGLIDGARGFMSPETAGAIDSLKGGEFSIPAARQPLPADDITPPRFQGLTDDQIRQEIELARKGEQAYAAQKQTVQQNNMAMLELRADAQKVAEANVENQRAFRRELSKRPNSGTAEEIREAAAAKFPTTLEGVLAQPDFVKRAEALRNPDMKGVEPLEVLQARQARLTDYLSQDPNPRSGTIPEVDLTTSQRMGLGESEEALQGLPFVHGQREASVESFNRQNTARVLSRIGEELPKNIKAGTQANAYVNQRLNQAYDQLRPSIKGRVDQSFNNGIAALRAKGTSTPELEALWAELEGTIQNFRKADGTFDGEGYRELSTRMRRYAETWGNNRNPATTVAMQDAARLAEQVRKQAQALVNRANPAVGRRLKTLEGAWAHQMRIEAASRGAAKQTDGVYAPEEYLNAIERLDTSRNKGAVARGKGFDQAYAQNARKVLGGKPAKKSSLRETAIAAFGISQGGPAVAVALGGLGLGYTPGVKKLIQFMAEGRLGKTPAAIEKSLSQSEAGRRLLKATDNDSRRALITQILRAKASEE